MQMKDLTIFNDEFTLNPATTPEQMAMETRNARQKIRAFTEKNIFHRMAEAAKEGKNYVIYDVKDISDETLEVLAKLGYSYEFSHSFAEDIVQEDSVVITWDI